MPYEALCDPEAYEKGEKMGVGTSAVVYKAFCKPLNQMVAVKGMAGCVRSLLGRLKPGWSFGGA